MLKHGLEQHLLPASARIRCKTSVMTISMANTTSINPALDKEKTIQLHLDEQLSSLRLGGMKQALNQQQAQSALYQEMGFEARLQLLLSQELVQRGQRKTNRLKKQARFRLAGQMEQLGYRANRGINKAQIRQLLEGHWLSYQ